MSIYQRISFHEWVKLFTESKQEIINLGYPEIIAKMFYKRFGKHAYLIAKWYRDYRTKDPDKNWWQVVHGGFSSRKLSLHDLVRLYYATNSAKEYKETLDDLGMVTKDDWNYDEIYLKEQSEAIKKEIENQFFSEVFFQYYSLIQDIDNGKLTDIAPYKDLNFREAQDKYDKKKVFEETEPLKTYKNGFRWIDVGDRCHLVGSLMKNCGSAGLMSSDPDKTLIVLFGPENKPHVIITYSPNEGKISSDQGIASSAVKPEYHPYILDLAKTLNVDFDYESSKSKWLKMKYLLQGKAKGLQPIRTNDPYDRFFKFDLDGKTYYSNSNVAVSREDAKRVEEAMKKGEINLYNTQKSLLKTIFNHRNEEILRNFVEFIPLRQLLSQ